MLRICTKSEFERYIDFAYGLAMDPTKSGYPTYRDGIKTKAMFVDRGMKAFQRGTERMLLFEREGKVLGLIHYFWLPEDRYMQTIGFYISRDAERALSEFVSYVGERFHGYELYMGFPAENREAVNFLAAHGFACIENDYNNTALLDQWGDTPTQNGLTRIGRENYDSFRRLHSQTDGDMYWNCDRIWDDLDRWSVFVAERDGKPRGAVYYKSCGEGWYEIVGVDLDQGAYDPEMFKELLSGALLDAKRRNGRAMTFFCEEAYEQAAMECGFTCVGNYLCYKTRLE